ncbi:MAG: cell division protein FtsZ [Phycisphaerales bacterium]|nr:cell division protein FtsZ [Phycisphaerales bacterium]
MIQFDLPQHQSSIIKVVGVGGGGGNAINYMFKQHIEGADFIICNTDAKALNLSQVPNKIQLGPQLTKGLGAGAKPEVGKAATEESITEIKNILEKNTKMLFVTAGMGGGTGTGGAPIVAQISKELGILTVGIVTTPFAFEGPKRLAQAQEGIKQLRPYVDTLLIINNDKLRLQYGDLKMSEAFSIADNVLATATKCITDIIHSKGHVIVDFADVCTVMKNGGVAVLGSAAEEGDNRAQKAVEIALSSPLLDDNDIQGAKWILLNILSGSGNHECTMDEIDLITNYIRQQAGADTDIIVGLGQDQNLGGKIALTLIATGFPHKDKIFYQGTQSMTTAKNTQEKIILNWDTPKNNTSLVQQPTPMKQVPVHTEVPKPEYNNTQANKNVIAPFQTNNDFVTSPQRPLFQKPLNIYDESLQEDSKKQEDNRLNIRLKSHSDLDTQAHKHFTIVNRPLPFPDNDAMNNPFISENNRPVNMGEDRQKIMQAHTESQELFQNDHELDLENKPAFTRRGINIAQSTNLQSSSIVESYYSKTVIKKKDDGSNQFSFSTLNSFLDGKKPD